MNSYTDPRLIRPGCQHQLGCRCQVPLWLRPSNGEERAFEERYFIPREIPKMVEGDL